MKLALISIALLALAFAGLAIKILVKKDGKFQGTCASASPHLSNGDGSCSSCGSRPEQRCKNS
jgi:rRNA maturation endonuclease Nob1